jgi:GNAT superfamily N-acetyltransferase
MPINFVPRERQYRAPRSGALRDAWGEAYKAYSRNPSLLAERMQVVEEGQPGGVGRGRIEANANEIIHQVIKQPAYALEAPLRPLNVATGGGVGEAFSAAWDFGKQIPILNIALGALEQTGNVLDASNKVGRAFLNYTLAEHLKNTVGKPDTYMSDVLGERLSAAEVRRRVTERWGVNPSTGEAMTLRALEARALEDTTNFGEFGVHENGFMNLGASALADPLNFALLGGPAALRAGSGAVRAASWARPAINYGTRLAGAPRIGYGALKSLGRQTVEGTRFVDDYTAARKALEGQLATHGTLAGTLRAASWMMRGLYLPGYGGMIERGASKGGALVTSYMRGGMQQQIATNAGEQLAGAANGWVMEQGLENTPLDGFTGWLNETLNKVNNDHFLSDHDSFTVVALFSPWAAALGDISRGIKGQITKGGLPRYADNTLYHLKNEFRRTYGAKDKYNAILAKMGRGDIDEGRRAWEWFTDQMEVFKAENQLTVFTRGTAAAIEDAANRALFLTDTVVNKVRVLREKGALQPKSLSDYMIDFYRSGGKSATGDTIAHQIEINPDNFYRFVNDMYRINRDLGGQMQKLGGLTVEQGAPVTREVLDGIIDMVRAFPEDDLIPRNIAADIIDRGPSLVWDSEFFSRFSSTLGQVQSKSGRFGRKMGMAEGVTVREVIDQLEQLKQNAPPAAELFHESVAATRRATKIKPGETMLTEPPYPMPDKLAQRRAYNTGRVKQLVNIERVLTNIRNVEFFKNGKPRLAAAKELVGHAGGLFKRDTHSGAFIRESDGARLSVKDGVLDASVLDSETIVLGVQHGGRVTVRPVSDGPLLAEHGFVEVSRIKGAPAPTARASRVGMGDDGVLRLDSSGPFADDVVNVAPENAPTGRRLEEMPDGAPDSIVFDDMGVSSQAVWHGPDGKPRAYAAVLRRNFGNPKDPGPYEHVSVYVDPAYRRQGIASRLYDELHRQGIDVRAISGKSVTEEGRAFTESYWSRSKPMASYAYRGGDVTRILENQKMGGFSSYKPTGKEASLSGAINAARRSATNASLFYPSMEATFPSLTKSYRAADPQVRLQQINEALDAARASRKSLIKQISSSDEIAMKLMGIDPSVKSKLGDWFNYAPKAQLDRVTKLLKNVNRDYPNLSVTEGGGIWIDPRADRFSTMVGYRNAFRRLAFDYGHLSPLTYLYTALFQYQNARHLGKQAQTEIHNLLAQSGFTASESRKFVTLLRDEVVASRSVPGSLGEFSGSHLYRSIRALPEGKTRELMELAAPGKTAEVLTRYGHVQKMLTEAANRMVRNNNRKARGGGKVDPLTAAVNSAYRIWQYAPGLEAASAGTHMFTKLLYPLFRFSVDPLYHTMNVIESDMYGVSMEGARASRWGKGVAGVSREQSARAAELSSVTSVPPGGLTSKDLPADLLLADPGAYTMPRNIRPVIERHFDIKRVDSAADVFRSLKDEDPVAIIMREHFGDDVKDWAKAADEMLYSWSTVGPEETVRQSFRRHIDEAGMTKEEAAIVAPMMERLASAHRGHYNDLVQLYIGRLNRSNLERIFDNFFLFWPLSYQIKATKWLATIMFQRAGGVNTGAGGAYLWDEYRARFNAQLESDAEFRNWFEDHDMATTMFEMIFPMTPEGIGVSLARPTRYVGSWIADGLEIDPDVKQTLVGDYPYVRTLPEMLANSLQIGPMRTARLVSGVMRQFEVPGFTYEDGEEQDPTFDPEDYLISNLSGS